MEKFGNGNFVTSGIIIDEKGWVSETEGKRCRELGGGLYVGWNRPHRDSDAECLLEWIGRERLGLGPVRVNESIHLVGASRFGGG